MQHHILGCKNVVRRDRPERCLICGDLSLCSALRLHLEYMIALVIAEFNPRRSGLLVALEEDEPW